MSQGTRTRPSRPAEERLPQAHNSRSKQEMCKFTSLLETHTCSSPNPKSIPFLPFIPLLNIPLEGLRNPKMLFPCNSLCPLPLSSTLSIQKVFWQQLILTGFMPGQRGLLRQSWERPGLNLGSCLPWCLCGPLGLQRWAFDRLMAPRLGLGIAGAGCYSHFCTCYFVSVLLCR